MCFEEMRISVAQDTFYEPWSAVSNPDFGPAIRRISFQIDGS